MKRNQTKKGQGLVEYVLLIALIALVAVATLTGMGQTVEGGLFQHISSNLDTANTNIAGS